MCIVFEILWTEIHLSFDSRMYLFSNHNRWDVKDAEECCLNSFVLKAKYQFNFVVRKEIARFFLSLLTFRNCIFRFVSVTKHIAKSQSVLLRERQTILQKFNLHFHFVRLHYLWNAAILRHDSIFTSPRLIVKTVEM